MNNNAFDMFFNQLKKLSDEEREEAFRAMARRQVIADEFGAAYAYEKIKEGYIMHCDADAINDQLTGILNTMKAMMMGFSPEEGVEGLKKNLIFFQNFWIMCVMPMTNLQENMEKFKNKYMDKK